MTNGKNKTLNFIEQPAEQKRVKTLLKAGNLKKISGRHKHSVNIARNRIISIVFSLILLIIGLISVFL
jgi:hypothetical protein